MMGWVGQQALPSSPHFHLADLYGHPLHFAPASTSNALSVRQGGLYEVGVELEMQIRCWLPAVVGPNPGNGAV